MWNPEAAFGFVNHAHKWTFLYNLLCDRITTTKEKIQIKFDITIQNWIIQVTSENMSISQQIGAFLCLNYS